MESNGGYSHMVNQVMIEMDDLVVPNVDEYLKPKI